MHTRILEIHSAVFQDISQRTVLGSKKASWMTTSNIFIDVLLLYRPLFLTACNRHESCWIWHWNRDSVSLKVKVIVITSKLHTIISMIAIRQRFITAFQINELLNLINVQHSLKSSLVFCHHMPMRRLPSVLKEPRWLSVLYPPPSLPNKD